MKNYLKNKHWYVIFHDFNTKEFKPYDVLNHYTFSKDLNKYIKKYVEGDITYSNLKERVRISAQSCFWARCEYEVVLSCFPPNENVDDKKIDIYYQLMLNFDVFFKYLLGGYKGV